MNEDYRTDPVATPLFAEADAQYAMMKETLTSAGFQGKTEAEVERWLTEEQRELMRRLFQSFVTLCGQAQAQEPVVGADGVSVQPHAIYQYFARDRCQSSDPLRISFGLKGLIPSFFFSGSGSF